jgi:hypothetical protein
VAEVEALHLPCLVVILANDLAGDVQGRVREESDVELEGHRQQQSHVILEVVLVVSVPAQVLRVVTHCLPELLRLADLLIAKTESWWKYLPRVIISLYSINPYILSAMPWVKLCRMG